MTVLHLPLVQERLDAADSGVAEQLWDALYAARAGRQQRSIAELEDAAFTFYLPLARTAASLVYGESAEVTNSAQQAAELGLARAILSWPHRTSSGFRRFARAVVIQQISDQAANVIAGHQPLTWPSGR
jgi:xanthine/CO dehydrogenase XdhC/CoxF family maturation factor